MTNILVTVDAVEFHICFFTITQHLFNCFQGIKVDLVNLNTQLSLNLTENWLVNYNGTQDTAINLLIILNALKFAWIVRSHLSRYNAASIKSVLLTGNLFAGKKSFVSTNPQSWPSSHIPEEETKYHCICILINPVCILYCLQWRILHANYVPQCINVTLS